MAKWLWMNRGGCDGGVEDSPQPGATVMGSHWPLPAHLPAGDLELQGWSPALF